MVPLEDLASLCQGISRATQAESLVLRPPTVLLLGVLLAAVLHFGVVKLRAFKHGFVKRLVVGLPLLAWGGFLVATCVRHMRRASTDPNHDLATTSLLRTGIYSFSRNPLYVGGGFLQLGLVLLTNSLWLLLNMLAQFAYLAHYVVPREEAHLASLYTAEYETYCREVPRWVSMDLSAGGMKLEL
jgi:protein-S-isoprenylcysteine O-methyltransferase Ste14